MIVFPFASQTVVFPRLALFWEFNLNNNSSFAYIFLLGSQSLPSREKYFMSKSETTASPSSENYLRRLLLDMKSDLIQHVQDCVSNAM